MFSLPYSADILRFHATCFLNQIALGCVYNCVNKSQNVPLFAKGRQQLDQTGQSGIHLVILLVIPL